MATRGRLARPLHTQKQGTRHRQRAAAPGNWLTRRQRKIATKYSYHRSWKYIVTEEANSFAQYSGRRMSFPSLMAEASFLGRCTFFSSCFLFVLFSYFICCRALLLHQCSIIPISYSLRPTHLCTRRSERFIGYRCNLFADRY